MKLGINRYHDCFNLNLLCSLGKYEIRYFSIKPSFGINFDHKRLNINIYKLGIILRKKLK